MGWPPPSSDNPHGVVVKEDPWGCAPCRGSGFLKDGDGRGWPCHHCHPPSAAGKGKGMVYGAAADGLAGKPGIFNPGLEVFVSRPASASLPGWALVSPENDEGPAQAVYGGGQLASGLSQATPFLRLVLSGWASLDSQSYSPWPSIS